MLPLHFLQLLNRLRRSAKLNTSVNQKPFRCDKKFYHIENVLIGSWNRNFRYDNEMNHIENISVSPHLQAERRRLLDAIAQIRKSGEVAPAYYWLSPQVETKESGKTYEYIKLNVKKPGDMKVKARSLGKPGSERHREWQQALARRDAIVELEQQITLVENLLDRQKARSAIVTLPQNG